MCETGWEGIEGGVGKGERERDGEREGPVRGGREEKGY